MKSVVKCLIMNDDDQILLIQRADDDSHGGSWETPGGGVDGEETLHEACVREVKEEAGVDLQLADVMLAHNLEMPDSETQEAFDVSLFTALVPNGTPVDLSDNPDHQDHKWISVEDIRSGQVKVDTWTAKQLEYV